MMDMTLNRIPETIRKIYMIAICGTAMGALAAMLKDLGYTVSGSDEKVYPPMSDFLRMKNIEVHEGFDPKRLDDRPDLVVIGNAVRRDNPEAVKVSECKLPFCSMPQAINAFIAGHKRKCVVTGTHGKTTTSSLMAWVFYTAGLDPSYVIGGILKDFDSNYRLGGGDVVVLEGDEYDTAFFDKGPKFMHYPPDMAILTGVEFDHADIYRDLDHVNSAFTRFVSSIPAESHLMVFDGDPNAKTIAQTARCRVSTYGLEAAADWYVDDIRIDPPFTRFSVFKNRNWVASFKTRLVGRHNLLNVLAVIGIAVSIGISIEDIKRALETFQGVRRRQEIRGIKRDITVMDDFAHHPTAVKETLAAVKPLCVNGRLIAVFEPRTNTSMRNIFQGVYPLCFDAADMVCIRQPSRLDKVPESERFSSETLVSDLNHRGIEAYHFQDTESIIDFLVSRAKKNDIVLIMSNGGFDNIHDRLLRYL